LGNVCDEFIGHVLFQEVPHNLFDTAPVSVRIDEWPHRSRLLCHYNTIESPAYILQPESAFFPENSSLFPFYYSFSRSKKIASRHSCDRTVPSRSYSAAISSWI